VVRRWLRGLTLGLGCCNKCKYGVGAGAGAGAGWIWTIDYRLSTIDYAIAISIE